MSIEFSGSCWLVALGDLRFVAASATVPNLGDLASWLECDDDSTFHFGPEFRPVPIKITVPERFDFGVNIEQLQNR